MSSGSKLGRVFILESPNPLDLLEGRAERLALEQVCRLVGHKVTAFLLRDRMEFVQTCRYISSIQPDKNDKTPLFLHISVHGDDDGIAVGRDDLGWKDLATFVQGMYDKLKYYHGHVILILSACGTNKQQLTYQLMEGLKHSEEKFIPPEYVIVFAEDTVDWLDAVVTWTIFYREAAKIDFKDKTMVQKLLDRLHVSDFGNLKYYRWDSTKEEYLRYQGKS